MAGERTGRRALVAACSLVALIALLVTAPLAAAAPKKAGGKKAPVSDAGKLDRSFSGDGKLVTVFPRPDGNGEYVNYRLPFEYPEGQIALAPARRGKLVAANGAAIIRYLRNGDRDPRFGANGAVPIARAEDSSFQLLDVAVDSEGRVLVAGMSRPRTGLGQEGLEVPGPIPSLATVKRFLSNGQPDPSFGAGGTVHTDLGVPPPTFEGHAYAKPVVSLVGITVDATDRPIVTGSAVTEVGRCKAGQNRYETTTGLVARLAVDGTLDPSFDGDGLKMIVGLSWAYPPVPMGGRVLSWGAQVDLCARGGGPESSAVLFGLTSSGSADAAFRGGSWSRPFTRIEDVAAAPKGKVLLLVRTSELVRGRWMGSTGEVVRLRANGSYDKGFGRGGILDDLGISKDPAINTVAADRAGRVLLAGTANLESDNRNGMFLLLRRTEDGEPDRGFGRRGRVMTGFGWRGNVAATDLLVMPGNRIVVGGQYSERSVNNALALARYLGRG